MQQAAPFAQGLAAVQESLSGTQEKVLVPTLAYVAAKNANPKRLDIFKKGLAELGYVEGENIRIEYRDALL
jgi:putative ABC transport system substrate-binding protein